MKILQLHCFYDQYLDLLYGRNPQLQSQPYQEQCAYIAKDGFAGAHLFTPYLNKLGVQSDLIIANNFRAQATWARENGVFIEGDPNWLQRVLRSQVAEFDPDLLYISHPLELESNFVRSLEKRPKFVMGWRAAPVPQGIDWSEFDLMLSHLSTCRAQALQRGARKARHFFPGFPAFLADTVANETKKYDIVFTGQWSVLHTKRCEYLTRLAQKVANGDIRASIAYFLAHDPSIPLPVEVAAINRGERWGVEMHRAIRSGRIVINMEIDMAGGEGGNMRLFETLGTGSFLLTEHHQNLEMYASPGEHFETFRSFDELELKVRTFLTSDDRREEIARNGQKYCLAKHSMEVRSRELLEIVYEEMSMDKERLLQADKASPTIVTTVGESAKTETVVDLMIPESQPMSEIILRDTEQVEQFLTVALDAVASDRLEEAFKVLIEAKKFRCPVPNLDYVRALCFIKMNKLGDAREALLEELRYFPENEAARNLLPEVVAEFNRLNPTQIHVVEDAEFKELLAVIRPYTMLPEERLFALFQFAKQVCELNIPGNFVECGVAAGGSTGMLSALVKRYSKAPRILWAFDSFEGMPKPTAEDAISGTPADDTGWGTGTCSAPEESVREICSKLGTSTIVKPVKGFFENTIAPKKAEVGKIALLHADCDWYQSTLTIFDTLYDSLVPGAVVQLDDYGYWDGMRKAMDTFQETRGIKLDIHPLNGAAWFQKPQN